MLVLPVAAQQSDVSCLLQNSNKQWRFEQRLRYYLMPLQNWQLSCLGNSLSDSHLDFNQTSRNNNLSLIMQNNNDILRHTFSLGYAYLYDHSDLASELYPYTNQTGNLAYGLDYLPWDSLTVSARLDTYYRKEQDRYSQNHDLISKGIGEQLSGRYTLGGDMNNLALNLGAEQRNLNWEAYKLYKGGLSANLSTSPFQLSGSWQTNLRSERVYIMNNPDSIHTYSYYRLSDTQNRLSHDALLSLYLPVSEFSELSLANQYNLRYIDVSNSQERGYSEYNNLTSARFDYLLTDRLKYAFNCSYTYLLKEFTFGDKNRLIDVRYMDNGLQWEYQPGDSLSVAHTMELRRTTYPKVDTRLDNDYLTQSLRFGWTTYWKERIRLRNRFLYQNKEEIFLDSWLSSNNNRITSYQWLTDNDILLSDCFLLQQSYNLRADYDDYFYNYIEGITDNFYRQLTVGYHMIYDDTPLTTKLGDRRWLNLPFGTLQTSAFRCDLGCTWERSQTSHKVDNYYLIDGDWLKQSVSLLLQKQYGLGIYALMPKYTWGDWREYSLTVSTQWKLQKDSYIDISFNPVGEHLDELDYKLTCSVSLVF